MAFWFWFMTSVFRWRNPIISEVCVMVEPCLATKPHTATHALPCLVGLGERIQRVKARKLDGWDKEWFYRESKSWACKQSKTGSSFTPSHMQAGVQPSPGNQGFTVCSGDLAGQMPALQTVLLPCHHMVLNIPCVRWGQLSWLGSPTSCSSLAFFLVGSDQKQKQKRPWCRESTAWQ